METRRSSLLERYRFRLVLLCVISILTAPESSTASAHPLDPLSNAEIKTTAQIIAASGKIDKNTVASIIMLHEPDKRDVLDWEPGIPQRRKAFAVLRVNAETIEVVVDITANEIESWTTIPGVQPPIHSNEWAQAQVLVKADPRWRAAMLERGYESYENIFCESLSAGYFGHSADSVPRLLKMPCYDISDAEINIYARPIEGVIATVDLDQQAVIAVHDEGVIAVGSQSYEFDEGSVPDLRDPMHPVRTTAPAGPNFRIDGRMVVWQGWSFHLGFSPRFGPVLSLIQIEDDSDARSVLYQAHISEVFVPYMAPSPSWSFRTYLDAGEFGLGTLSSILMPGIDCPPHALFFDADLSTPSGGATRRERVTCVFERDPVAPLWRHSEALNGRYEGRPATELVVRSIPSIAHYDYVIDWVFSQSGMIEIKIGATGIDAVQAVSIDPADDTKGERSVENGSLVAPGLVAIHHDHFFSIRLDFDIDGTHNRFVRERLVSTELQDNPRRSLWRVEEIPINTEGAIPATHDPEIWRIENTRVKTELGHHPSYQIQGHNPTSLLPEDDWRQRRAAFSAHPLWITSYKTNEAFAAGAYPNQSRGGDGLPTYVSGETIDQADVVAWYTIGFHHVTRPEDWPVLSTMWQSVKLRPFRFFTRNPSVTVRRRFAGELDNVQ